MTKMWPAGRPLAATCERRDVVGGRAATNIVLGTADVDNSIAERRSTPATGRYTAGA